MILIKAYTKSPGVSAHILDGGGRSLCIDDGNDRMSLAFPNSKDLYLFAAAVTRAVEGIDDDHCDICGFNVELIGHSAECPKREGESA